MGYGLTFSSIRVTRPNHFMPRFTASLNGASGKIRVENTAELREAGCVDEELPVIVTGVAPMATVVCNNRWMPGLGVEPS